MKNVFNHHHFGCKQVSLIVQISMFAILFIALPNTSYAISETIEGTSTAPPFESHLKGYSMEKHIGSNNWVAAGTHYNYNTTTGLIEKVGIHFLFLSPGGTVLISKVYEHPDFQNKECRVVDIVPADNDYCWIVTKVRHKTLTGGTQIYDYAYSIKVDVSTGAVVDEVSLTLTYHNTYPTHALYKNENLYICGFVSYHINDATLPTNSSKEKEAFVAKIDLTAGSQYNMTSRTWNTSSIHPVEPDEYDYDMALRMRDLGDNGILIVGAGNDIRATPTPAVELSAVLLMHINDDLTENQPANVAYADPLNGAIPATVPGDDSPYPPGGYYGVDILRTTDNGLYVLVNNYGITAPLRWGILRVGYDLMADLSSPDLMLTHATHEDWAKQFYKIPNTHDRDFAVVGERSSVSSCITPPNPSTVTNVNPFVTNL